MTFDFSLHDRTQFTKNSAKARLNGLRPLFLICVEKGYKDALMKYERFIIYLKSKPCVIITSTKSDVWIKYIDAKIYLLHNMYRYSIQTMGYLISLDLELTKT